MTATTLNDLVSEFAALRERFKSEGEALLKQAFSEFFDRCPGVHCVVWAQYAPYFNDGDPCVFSVHDAEVYPPGHEDEGYERGYSDWNMLYYRSDVADEQVQSVFKELLTGAFTNEEIMQAVFGDDCMVKATREGFDISSYEHD